MKGIPRCTCKKRDIENYVTLLKEAKVFLRNRNPGWGLTFTAPTSYWYLRWFDIKNLIKHADWMNFMTYDLHGDWDSPSDNIGSKVYAHTNLTEISDALDLLWRNDVPANQVTLGLGFYGRSYTLKDPKCSKPGCAFTEGGNPGPCSHTRGFLTYSEIQFIHYNYRIDIAYDKKAAVKYFSWDKDQWVSFDDTVTLKQKVDYANKRGLLGLFIWAVDLDDASHNALDAVLYPKGLGKFKSQNGVGNNGQSDWTLVTGNGCEWSEPFKYVKMSNVNLHALSYPECGERCGFGQMSATNVYCGQGKDTELRKHLCCPFGNVPDPDHCSWTGGKPM
ncbi:hypothetical protein TWF696_008250 [Orbilia brochopaga]|uniref:chitinase n=1 Tax=Orbilia brochopaga TaxID=3140254 RepID=A0AAV9UIL5_9PEZI